MPLIPPDFCLLPAWGRRDKARMMPFWKKPASVEARTGMTILRGIDSPVQAIERAREAQALGIEFIKLWVDDRGGSQTRIA